MPRERCRIEEAPQLPRQASERETYREAVQFNGFYHNQSRAKPDGEKPPPGSQVWVRCRPRPTAQWDGLTGLGQD